nr:immunoglobulin light chain junction region [Homo sapiens]
CLNYSLYSF